MLIPRTLWHIKILCKMFNIKSGTISEIGKVCGVDNNTCILYRLKPFLLWYGIWKEEKYVDYRTPDKTLFRYKIDFREIDRFLLTETFLRDIYNKRIYKGELMTLRKLKPKIGL